MPRRRHKSNLGGWFELPTLPFLSIMLGLMSVMALASIGIAIQKRREKKKETLVTLVEIPAGLVPVHIRCKPDRIQWQNELGQWQELYLGDPTRGRTGLGVRSSARAVRDFVEFIQNTADNSRKLSFSGRQHTVILWIEPDAVYTAYEVQRLFLQLGLPLRLGRLPVMREETIVNPPSQ